MIGRPMLRAKVLMSTAAEWFRRPVHEIAEGDLFRWQAIRYAASLDYTRVEAIIHNGQ